MSFGPVTPLDPAPLSWADYQARTDGPIPEGQWDRHRLMAERTLAEVTYGRAAAVTDDALLERVRQATCVVADAHFAAAGGVVSESLGGYSYTRSSAITPMDVDKVEIGRAHV